MRGEDLKTSRTGDAISGSPPHARGRLNFLADAKDVARITPACAGKTVSTTLNVQDSPGSPPHARGRHRRTRRRRNESRITPACAGKTPGQQRQEQRVSDHPRMRGEDAQQPYSPVIGCGSPPHARGRLHRGRPGQHEGRITPACAGKTGGRPDRRARAWDHPRMRGEDVELGVNPLFDGGSPPHARGRH